MSIEVVAEADVYHRPTVYLSRACIKCMEQMRCEVRQDGGSKLTGWGKARQLMLKTVDTRRPASAYRTARRQFQAAGQPVGRTQASDAITSRLPRYEAKCVQRRCFQCGSVPLRSDIKGTEPPPANILIPLERQLIALQLCRWQLLYNETLQQTSRILLSKLVWKTTNLGIWYPFWGS